MTALDNGRSLKEIAEEITRDWQYPHHDAIPYLDEMRTNSIDRYSGTPDEQERALIVVTQFLCHAHTWHGPTASRVKKELNSLFFVWYGRR
jgi:hypothetical protein